MANKRIAHLFGMTRIGKRIHKHPEEGQGKVGKLATDVLRLPTHGEPEIEAVLSPFWAWRLILR